MKIRKALALGFAATAAATVTTVGLTGPADAASSCSSILQEQSVVGPNLFRAGAICTRVESNRKVRAWLQRDGGPDYYSQYFTRTNVYYFTDWYTCYAGCDDAYQVSRV